jgi:hypothetical protein
MVRKVLPALLLAGTVLTGCAVHEARKDHDLIRSTLLDLYTNQIMDNLVRTANGLPIIQLDYTNAAAQVTVTTTIGGSDNQVATTSNVLAIPAAALSATRTIATTLAGNLGGTNANQISIGAVPVITSNDVYDAYIEYLDSQKNPGGLIVTCDPPPPGAAHLCKKFNGQYYWVPIEKRKEFFRLALATTAQRGKAFQAPDKFFTVSLDNPVKDDVRGTVTFDVSKQKLPIDFGTLTLDSDTPAAPAAPTQFQVDTVTAPIAPGGLPPSTAAKLVVTLPNDEIGLQLEQNDTNRPSAQKNLFYVSLMRPANTLHFLIFGDDGKVEEFFESSLPNHDAQTIQELKDDIVKKLAGQPFDNRAKNADIRRVKSVLNIPLHRKMAMFAPPYPKTGKISLSHNVPPVQTTEDALSRVNFQLQQIQFNQQRQLSP